MLSHETDNKVFDSCSRNRVEGSIASALAAFALILMSTPMPTNAQGVGGPIDTRAATERRIYELEGLLSGDVPAERQAVALRWLADLYVSVGRVDDAQAAYERILAFFPYDAAASNAYAEFLLDTRGDPERALEVTHNAIGWANSAPSPPPYIGQTYAIRARAFAKVGKCEDALRVADQAVALSEDDASEDARRTKSQCLSKLGHNKEARATLLELIGDTGASNPDDESALVAILARDRKSVDAAGFDGMVNQAVTDARKRRAEALAHENATLVELQASNHVRLEATLRAGEGPSAILFIADVGSRRSAYTPYAQLMTLDGFTTLTLDMRGQGDSRCDSLPSIADLPAHQYDQLPGDIAAAFTYLVETRKIDRTRIAIVAAGYACGFVERAIHEYNLAPVAVHLSPVFDAEDLDLVSAISFRPPRPVLAVASDEDTYAVRSLGVFSAAVPSDLLLTKRYKSAGHGVSILRDPARYLDVDTWVKSSLAGTAGK
jgi:tetratricopeptide (TPR) repeat protein